MEVAMLDDPGPQSWDWPAAVDSNLFSCSAAALGLPRRFLAMTNSLWTVNELISEYMSALHADDGVRSPTSACMRACCTRADFLLQAHVECLGCDLGQLRKQVSRHPSSQGRKHEPCSTISASLLQFVRLCHLDPESGRPHIIPQCMVRVCTPDHPP
jgi:hypothetical protein